MQNFVKILNNTIALIKQNWVFFFVFWLVLLGLDLSNYFFHLQAGASEQNARTIEIIFQLILVFYSVCFFHGLNLKGQELEAGVVKIVGESLLLTPGFVLQSIFFALALALGFTLLVLPGFYVLFFFYFAPVVAVLYPDFQGKVFMLARELVLPQWQVAIFVVLFSGALPLIPEAIIWATTGALKSPATPFIAPLDGALYLFCETVVFVFIFALIKEHRAVTGKT